MYMEAINLYNNVYNMFDYYRLVIVRDDFINFRIYEFIKVVKNLETEAALNNYHCEIFNAMYNIMYQTYLYSVIDLSYCRLAKHNLIYNIGLNDTLQLYYQVIYENKYLNKVEKARIYYCLFDSLRMSEINENGIMKPNNIETFLQNKIWDDNDEKIQLSIKCEPIDLMFLKMFEYEDIENINLFMKMNLESRTIKFVKILCILGITSILSKGKQKRYLHDLSIEKDTTIKIIRKLHFDIFEIEKDDSIEFEEIIISYYSEKDIPENVKIKPYIFNPRLNFSSKVITTYFYSKGLTDTNRCDNTILETIECYK